MARTNNLTNFLTDVATAIKAKKGDETPILASDFDTEIENLPSGGGMVNDNVRFFDFDGTILYQYSKEDFLALEEMPPNPSADLHPELTPAGWNWTLEEAKTHITAVDYLDVGQLYDTPDDAVRLYITTPNDNYEFIQGLYPSTPTLIDWGDGTTSTTSYSGENYKHTYELAGDYVVTIQKTVRMGQINQPNVVTRIDVGGIILSKVNTGISEIKVAVSPKSTVSISLTGSGIKHLTLSRKTTSIGSNAIDSSTLKTLSLPPSIVTYGSTFIYNKTTVLDRLILPYVNSNTLSLNVFASNVMFYGHIITFPPNVTTINMSYGSTYWLDNLKIPSTVTDFRISHNNLSSLSLPPNVTTLYLGNNGRGGIKNLTLSGVTSLSLSFNSIFPISNLTFNDPVTYLNLAAGVEIKKITLAYTGTMNNIKFYGNNVEEVEFLDTSTITALDYNPFNSYPTSNVKKVRLPNSLTSMDMTFSACNYLKEVTNLENTQITTMTREIFYNTKVKKLTFPSTISSLSVTGVQGLFPTVAEELDFTRAEQIPTITGSVFGGLPSTCVIKVPASLYDDWVVASGWSGVASQIVAVETGE